jgi:hypothetical protein
VAFVVRKQGTKLEGIHHGMMGYQEWLGYQIHQSHLWAYSAFSSSMDFHHAKFCIIRMYEMKSSLYLTLHMYLNYFSFIKFKCAIAVLNRCS